MSNQIVIGAGFGRTGTLSMKAALEQLGCGPTYHMLENILHGHWKHWVAMGSADPAEKEKILRQALSGYNSCVDFPTCAFFDDLLRINPEAKVVLTVRDSPQAWVKSVKATIFMIDCGSYSPWSYPGSFPVISQITKMCRWLPLTRLTEMKESMSSKMFVGADGSPIEKMEFTDANLAAAYSDWISHVKRSVPPEKLLVFNVKQGWEPLCTFLGMPVPEGSFPRVNEGGSLRPKLIAMDCIGVVVALSIATMMAAVCLAIWSANSDGLFFILTMAIALILLLTALEKIMIATHGK